MTYLEKFLELNPEVIGNHISCDHCLYKDICKYESSFRQFMNVGKDEFTHLDISGVRCKFHKHKE